MLQKDTCNESVRLCTLCTKVPCPSVYILGPGSSWSIHLKEAPSGVLQKGHILESRLNTHKTASIRAAKFACTCSKFQAQSRGRYPCELNLPQHQHRPFPPSGFLIRFPIQMLTPLSQVRALGDESGTTTRKQSLN
jgi:hypothetical protein